jgi:hypothetical protein
MGATAGGRRPSHLHLVAALLVAAAATVVAQEKLEGYCSTGLDPVDVNSGHVV